MNNRWPRSCDGFHVYKRGDYLVICFGVDGHPLFPGKLDTGLHRYKMAKKLGRCLLRSEHVHHRNGNRLDNRLSNLVLLTAAEHAKQHHAGAVRSQAFKDNLSLYWKRHGRTPAHEAALDKASRSKRKGRRVSAALKGRPKSASHRLAVMRARWPQYYT